MTDAFRGRIPVTRLVPIVFVGDAAAERDFYLKLGFEISYEGPEYPGLVALQHGTVEFGIEQRADFDPETPGHVLVWQFGVSDLDAAKSVLDDAEIPYEEMLQTPRADWRYRILQTTTPNGYSLVLEGEREAGTTMDQ